MSNFVDVRIPSTRMSGQISISSVNTDKIISVTWDMYEFAYDINGIPSNQQGCFHVVFDGGKWSRFLDNPLDVRDTREQRIAGSPQKVEAA